MTTQRQYTPTVRSFIPLLYVAWADGMLSPSEVKLIHEEIDKLPGLDETERSILKKWSDPKEWPEPEVFRQWISLIKESASDMDATSLASLAKLGSEMARRSVTGGQPALASEDTRQALEHLQKEIGLRGMNEFRSVSTGEETNGPGDANPISELLSTLLDGASRPTIARMKSMLADPVFQFEPHRDKEQYRAQVLEWATLLADQGFGALGFPREFGGANDLVAYAAVFEMLAMHDLSLAIKFGVHFGLFGGSVYNLGTEKHHQRYLQSIADLSLPGCFAMTETGHGSNVRDLETTATYLPDSQEIEVHSPAFRAGKEYIGNALHAQMATVFAQLIVDGENHGVHAVLVPIRSKDGVLIEGVRVEDNGYKMGLNGVDNGRIWFDQVRVPRENLLDRFGTISEDGVYHSSIANPSKRFFTMLGTLVAGRICVAKAAISASKVALTIATRYALHRRQFGPDKSPETLLLDYPTHQRRLMPPIAKVYATHFALEHLMVQYANRDEDETREIETIAAGIKAYATWLATDTIQECREACGGKGYLWENRFADLKADSDIFTTFEGDNTVLLQLVAKGLLGAFKESFHDAGFRGVYRYLVSQASDSLITINPIYKRKTDADHLVDPDFFKHALQFRERKLLHSLGDRMRTMMRKRITPYDVFLRTQNHMLTLAMAFVERYVFERFHEIVEKQKGSMTYDLLCDVQALFALSTIEENKGWFLEQDYMEGVKTKAIRRQVDRLCRRLRDQAPVLIDGFGVPNGLVAAPIAFQTWS